MPYIYATALPGDIVKLGRGTDKTRARAAQTYYVAQVQVLALWSTNDAPRDERRAQRACKEWHKRGELYHVPVDWLVIDHPLVERVSAILGTPLKEAPRQRAKGRGKQRKTTVTRRSQFIITSSTRVAGVNHRICKHGHNGAVWRSGNCLECVRLSSQRLRARREAQKT